MCNGVGWNQQGSFGKRANRTIDWGDGPPSTITSQAEGDVWIDYHDPSLLKVYTIYCQTRWWICLAIWKNR